MAFLKIESTNPNLSWVLEKKPDTGVVIKSNKQGYVFGFFPLKEGKIVENEYCIYFKDASDEVTYKKHVDESFEYLSSSKYNNARFINDSIGELLLSARENLHSYLEKGLDYDVIASHKLMVNVVETQYKTIDIFQRYFTDIEIKSEEVSKNNYRLWFETKKECTFSHFLNVVCLFGIFASLNSDDYIYLHESIIPKYLKILNRIDAPYFIRYLYKVRIMRNEKHFDTFKDELVKTKLYDSLEMTAGDTHAARIDFIKENVSLKYPIIDIGPGIDFKYLKIFGPKLLANDIPYYAIEKDFDASERIKAGIRNRDLTNVELFESLDEFIEAKADSTTPFTVICTEVLEHNEIEEVKVLLSKVLKTLNFNQFIITVPNVDFNQFYGIEKRHDDHKWEYSKEEFKNLITACLQPIINEIGGLACEYYKVGDKVNGIAVTTGLIIKKVTNLTNIKQSIHEAINLFSLFSNPL